MCWRAWSIFWTSIKRSAILLRASRSSRRRRGMITSSLLLVIGIVAVALIFDFTNGVHDAANSIATIVSTRVLSPRQAVVWAAFFNFIAAFGFGVHVANTIGKGLVDPGVLGTAVIAAALIGASLWDWIPIVFG